MRIGSDNSIKRTEKTAGASRAKKTDGVFSIESQTGSADDDAIEEASALSSSLATAGISSLLSLQEVQLDKEHNQEAYDYGKGLLLQLRSLQTELLVSGVSIGRLNSMQNFVRQNRHKAIANPAMSGILVQIETRIAIEMAKYGRDIQLNE